MCRDYQELKIQDVVSNLTVGSIPRSILVILTDDIVDTCKAGDDVVVVGMSITLVSCFSSPLQQWKPHLLLVTCTCPMMMIGFSVYTVVREQ